MNDITFVITAHCMKKEPTNSSHIIKTIQSFNLIKHFNNTKFIISFDGNKYPDLEKQYDTFKHDIRIYLNLHFDSSQYKMIYHSQNLNLVGHLRKTLSQVKTKYVFIIQQDLPFIQPFDLSSVLLDMEQHPQIKHLRFNDTINKPIPGQNTSLDKIYNKFQIKTKHNNYISTGIFCDRNHISTIQHYNDVIMKECPDKPNRRWYYPCWGMEHFFCYKPMDDHDKFGIYMFGHYGMKPMIKHTRAGR
jgi:hypothetical protein